MSFKRLFICALIRLLFFVHVLFFVVAAVVVVLGFFGNNHFRSNFSVVFSPKIC